MIDYQDSAPLSPRRTAAVLAVLLVLAACAAPTPIPSDRFYRLGGIEEKSAAPWVDGVVYVPPFRVSGVHAERAMLIANESGTRMSQRRYDFWADDPSRMLQQKLVDYLRDAGVAEVVTANRPETVPDVVVTGRVIRFELTDAGEGYRPVVTLAFEIADDERGPFFARTFSETGPSMSFENAVGGDGFTGLVSVVFRDLLAAGTAALPDRVAAAGTERAGRDPGP